MYILNCHRPLDVISLGLALPVIPAWIAAKPTTPLAKAPANLSNKGRTAKVTDSLRVPLFNWPYSTLSVIVINAAKKTSGYGKKNNPTAIKTTIRLVPANKKRI